MNNLEQAIKTLEWMANHSGAWQWSKVLNNVITILKEENKKCKADY